MMIAMPSVSFATCLEQKVAGCVIPMEIKTMMVFLLVQTTSEKSFEMAILSKPDEHTVWTRIEESM
jgi:hypothetical protein